METAHKKQIDSGNVHALSKAGVSFDLHRNVSLRDTPNGVLVYDTISLAGGADYFRDGRGFTISGEDYDALRLTHVICRAATLQGVTSRLIDLSVLSRIATDRGSDWADSQLDALSGVTALFVTNSFSVFPWAKPVDGSAYSPHEIKRTEGLLTRFLDTGKSVSFHSELPLNHPSSWWGRLFLHRVAKKNFVVEVMS